MLSFACLAMTLLPAPAHAGHWVFTTTASGQSTLDGRLQRTLYVPSGPTTNSVTTSYALSASESYGPATGTGPPVTETATSDLTLTVKAAWTADGNSDDTQPPDGIWFSEDTTATGTFSSNGGPTQASTKVDDGFQDPITQSGDSIGTAAKVHYVKSSGGSVTTTLTASVTSTGTTGAAGGASASASIGPITISIHAQPYNFRSSSYTNASGVFRPAVTIDNPNATLSLSYVWSSTDGSVSDLTTCMVDENITWDTNTVGTLYPAQGVYAPPSPPAGTDAKGNPIAYADPTVLGGPATDGAAMDTFSPDSAYKGTYSTISWWGDQVYVFSDSATGETNTPMPGPASGSFRITRAFAPTGTPSGTTGTLTISTRGHSAGPKNLQ